MPFYHTLGKIPRKRHTQFRRPDGGLYAEELFSTEGFSNTYSNLYHIYPPTRILRAEEHYSVAPEIADPKPLQHRSFEGFNVKPDKDFLESRKTVLINDDVAIILAAPKESMKDYFYKNANADEMIFVHEGKGRIVSTYGVLPFEPGDYIIISRGTIYQIEFENENNRLLIVEAYSKITVPKRYRNEFGQLLEHSPYCERDVRIPQELLTIDEKGEFLIKVKKTHEMYPYYYANHPFDVVGWDGCNYPWILSIHDFEPITGRIHQPPPVHQTFEAHNFVVCSFVPRLFDYHPLSIPVPYNHSNIDSDELLYYVDGDFMSRKHVTRGMITLHPGGVPHGPHPGTVEKSLGAKETKELAVMIDTFRPLKLTKDALKIEIKDYYKSWLEE